MQILRDGGQYDDLSEVAKLFALHGVPQDSPPSKDSSQA
jgi:hypothetical protein